MFQPLSRRSVLGFLARFLPLALGSGAVAQILRAAESEPGSDSPPALLPSVIRELFPHAGLGDDFYAEIAGTLWQKIPADRRMPGDVEAGIARLATCCGGGWEHAGRDARVAALTAVQHEVFFQTLREAALTLIYRDPRVWQRIGYGGNALAQGGYLTRGFDHIDWLPVANP